MVVVPPTHLKEYHRIYLIKKDDLWSYHLENAYQPLGWYSF